MQRILDNFPEVAKKYNISEEYYQEFLDNFLSTTSDKKLCYNILLTTAYSSLRENEDKAVGIIEEIEKNPDYKDFIKQEQIDRIMSRINIKLGKVAPDFSVALLSGEKVNLSDYSGKYVFLDFWGSWCSPCRKEIPFLQNFYNSTSRDNVVVIGLAGREEESQTRNFIDEQNINYPNAMASNALLAKYGIRQFPTSFLINPKGKIVRMNIRGESEYELIKEDIENYFE